MDRSGILKAAVAALLAPVRGSPRAQSPPTPIRLVDVQGRLVAGAVVSTYFEYDRGREPFFIPTNGSLIPQPRP